MTGDTATAVAGPCRGKGEAGTVPTLPILNVMLSPPPAMVDPETVIIRRYPFSVFCAAQVPDDQTDQGQNSSNMARVMIVATNAELFQKMASEPLDIIIDCRKASSALSPRTIASTIEVIG